MGINTGTLKKGDLDGLVNVTLLTVATEEPPEEGAFRNLPARKELKVWYSTSIDGLGSTLEGMPVLERLKLGYRGPGTTLTIRRGDRTRYQPSRSSASTASRKSRMTPWTA